MMHFAVNPLEIELSENNTHTHIYSSIPCLHILLILLKTKHKTKTPVKMSFIDERKSLTGYSYSQLYYICSKTLKVFSHLIFELYYKLRKQTSSNFYATEM